MNLQLRAFRAIEEPDTCQKYIDGHRSVLKDYGVSNITSAVPTQLGNENVFLVVAEDLDNNTVEGGIRVQIADGKLPLPIETAIGDMDTRVLETVEKFRKDGGVGELCGLWNSKAVAGKGISMILTRASIAIINRLRFRTLVGICADYTLPMFSQVGFVVDKSMGENGEFAYPNPNYVTRVLGILNAETLETAQPYDKERMLSLREDLDQTRMEQGPKGEFEIHYRLSLPTLVNENA